MDVLNAIMDANEAAELWGLKPTYIKDLCALGKVQARKIGGSWIIVKDQPNPAQPANKHNWRSQRKIFQQWQEEITQSQNKCTSALNSAKQRHENHE